MRAMGRSWLRMVWSLAALAVIVAFAIAPASHGIDASDPAILGMRPNYGPTLISNVANLAAAGPLLWVPGLDDGWDPQGLAFVEGNLLVSAYRSDRSDVNRGPCRVFRVDPTTGRETGHFTVPAPCGHAGGLAYAGGGRLYVADTHTLFEVALTSAFTAAAPEPRVFPLGPGLIGALAASGHGAIWIGTYKEDEPGKIYKFDAAFLATLTDGTVLTEAMSSARLDIPSYAQGAAVEPDTEKLWISRSEIAWGSLDRLDAAAGVVEQRYPVPGGIEGIAFDPAGRLWAVSEAGARHLPLRYPFFPLIFRLDLERMAAAVER